MRLVQEWLLKNAPGYEALSEVEREAITDFGLLWSFFESKSLRNNANFDNIRDLVHRLAGEGDIAEAMFAEAVAYFKDRYFPGDVQSHYWPGLRLQRARDEDVVLNFFGGNEAGAGPMLFALLMIVYRFRNNLMHGEKWGYELKGQFDNFTHANSILMLVMDADEAQLRRRYR